VSDDPIVMLSAVPAAWRHRPALPENAIPPQLLHHASGHDPGALRV